MRQIVGYDAAGLGGWDPETGKRLWELIPPYGSDFNVATPVSVGGKVLLATENNATRMYAFNDDGTINPKPVAVNEDMAPDTCSPVVYQGHVYANAYGELFCLKADTLETVWRQPDDMYYEHSNVIAGNGRVLISTMNGDLVLLGAGANAYKPLRLLRPFGKEPIDTLSHPAIVGNRLYVRSQDALVCLELTKAPHPSEP
ncbi:MAG: PQQ-binding-like beta-propeller repeat protein [Planctomycetota bacterium]|jgi:outer membrane protein assembly factor BamB